MARLLFGESGSGLVRQNICFPCHRKETRPGWRNPTPMRRFLIGLCVVSLMATVVAPSAARPAPERSYEAPYRTPAPGAYTAPAHAWYYDCETGVGCALIPIRKRDRRVTLQVLDATGLPVRAEVYTMPGGRYYFHFCGEMSESMPVTPGMELLVHVVPGTCPDGATPSSPTTGTVKATFVTRR